MKVVFKIVIALFLLTSFKSWDASKVGVKKEPLSPKLLTLDRKIEDVANTTVVTNPDQMRFFTKEVEENLIDPYGDKYGYIIMKQNIIKFKAGMMPWIIPNAILFYTPILFGLPFTKPKYIIEIEFRIMDSQNKLIGKYSATGKGSCVVAMYYGYSLMNAGRKIYLDALNDAFNQIRPLIQADALRLNEKLKEAGKL